MPRPKNQDIGKTFSIDGVTYVYNGRLHEKITYSEWLKIMKEAKAHGMKKAAFIKYKLGIPLSPNRFSHGNLQGNQKL